jgi:cephalosporin hydroxylase
MWNVAREACVTWRAWQSLPELAEMLYQVALEEPKVVVEIGSYFGGSLYAWRNLPGQPLVYSVTLEYHGEHDFGATVLEGDSHDRATLQRLKDQLGGRPVDVMFHDGDHTLTGTVNDWNMYGPLIRPGGLFLIHDIECAGEPQVRPAWDRIAAEVVAAGGSTEEIVARAGKRLGFGVARVGDGS